MSLVQLFTGALRLQTETYEVVKQASDGFWRVLKLVIVVSLVAGIGGCANVFRDEARAAVQEQRQALQGFRQFERFMPPAVVERMSTQTQLQLTIMEEIARVDPPLRRVPSRVLKTFGDWLASPLSALAGWFAYALAVLLVAKLLGGTGTLAQHLSLAGLSFAPHVLDIVRNLPDIRFVATCGSLLAIIAWIWGSVIYVKGVAIANDLDYTRALVAWAVPFVVVAVLVIALVLVGAVVGIVAGVLSA